VTDLRARRQKEACYLPTCMEAMVWTTDRQQPRGEIMPVPETQEYL
jgi:hypothetical protein